MIQDTEITENLLETAEDLLYKYRILSFPKIATAISLADRALAQIVPKGISQAYRLRRLAMLCIACFATHYSFIQNFERRTDS